MHKYIYSIAISLTLLIVIGASCEMEQPIPVERIPDTASSTETALEDSVEILPAYECDEDEDCSGKMTVCENNRCIFLTEIQAGSQACSYYVDGVQQNWGCGPDQWCGTSSGECLDNPQCETAPDCGEGQVCTNGYCLGGQNGSLPENSPCTNNAQCISGKVCVDGGCTPAEEVLLPEIPSENSPCASQDQCIKGKMCVDGECIPEPLPPSGVVCESNGLTWECDSGGECGDKGGKCFYADECREESDCGSQQYCMHGYCMDKYKFTGASCQTYSDCGGIDNFVCINGQCAESAAGKKKCENDIQIWSCDNDNYRCGSTLGECIKHSCSSNTDCKSGWTCYQGGCMQDPNECSSHLECLNDDATCQDGYCTWPGENDITCNNSYGDRWYCPNIQTCSDIDGECLNTQSINQACSYYVNGVQQNWGCRGDQWCGTSEDECFNEPFCELAEDCETGNVCINGYCGPSQ
ncbi:hypothetical protein HOF40_04420 [Candidatus Parcubacteria bacterium]|jgi:hypothetical protein|nr:hypothetical protein [Candidatus Parcubacteria bacterium]MBT3949308.1 hypothetical protein [Candidatus Parcubacteria bacterium]